MLLREKVKRVIQTLSVDHGAAWAHEWYKRRAVRNHGNGKICGERSFSREERRLEKEGWLVRRPIWPGDRLPNGRRATKRAVRCIWLTRQQWRSNRRTDKKKQAAEFRPTHPPPKRAPRPHRTPQAGPGAPGKAPHRTLTVGLSTVSPEELQARQRELERIFGKPKP